MVIGRFGKFFWEINQSTNPHAGLRLSGTKFPVQIRAHYFPGLPPLVAAEEEEDANFNPRLLGKVRAVFARPLSSAEFKWIFIFLAFSGEETIGSCGTITYLHRCKIFCSKGARGCTTASFHLACTRQRREGKLHQAEEGGKNGILNQHLLSVDQTYFDG